MPLFRRPVVRAVLVDHAYRVLLLHVTDGRSTWWEPPLADDVAAWHGVRTGPCVWTSARERFHLAWLDDPNAPGAAPVTATTLGAHWWTLDELAESAETFRPASLPALAPAVVRGEYGTEPVRL